MKLRNPRSTSSFITPWKACCMPLLPSAVIRVRTPDSIFSMSSETTMKMMNTVCSRAGAEGGGGRQRRARPADAAAGASRAVSLPSAPELRRQLRRSSPRRSCVRARRTTIWYVGVCR